MEHWYGIKDCFSFQYLIRLMVLSVKLSSYISITEMVTITNVKKHTHEKTIFYENLCSIHNMFLKVLSEA